MSERFIKIAVTYFVIAITFGLFMSMSNDHNYKNLHVHLALLGWASLALAGLIYRLYPAASQSKLVTMHFWLHNIGLPIMLIGWFFVIGGNIAFGPIIGLGALITSIGILIFAINVCLNVKSPSR